MQKTIKPLKPIAVLLLAVCLNACDKEDDIVNATIVKEWNLTMSTKNENPAVAGRNETAAAQLQLYSDNTLHYMVTLNTALSAGDAITAGHLHTGDPVTNGGVILDLKPVLSGNMAMGVIPIPRQSLADSIETGSVYINFHSTQVPGGLLRAQLDKTLDLVMDVPLSGANEVPAINTTATGVALLRLASDKTLFYRINVANLEANDALTAAHIHPGAAGVNGGVLVGLISNAADFGVPKNISLTDAAFTAIKTDPLYVNVHSTNRGSGLIRGQIR